MFIKSIIITLVVLLRKIWLIIYLVRHREHSHYQRGESLINRCLTFGKLPYLSKHQNPHLLNVVGKCKAWSCFEQCLEHSGNAKVTEDYFSQAAQWLPVNMLPPPSYSCSSLIYIAFTKYLPCLRLRC